MTACPLFTSEAVLRERNRYALPQLWGRTRRPAPVCTSGNGCADRPEGPFDVVVVVIRPLDEPAPASSVAHWAGFADNRQGEMPALRVTDGDASTGHPLASRAEDAVDLTGVRIAARQRTRIRHELVTTHAVGAVGPIGAVLTGRSLRARLAPVETRLVVPTDAPV